MLSPSAARYGIAEQATLDPRALQSLYTLLLPVLSDASQFNVNLCATSENSIAGEGDEATRSGVVAGTHEHLTREPTGTVTTTAGGSHEHRCRSRIFMQPSEDRHGEGRGRPAIQQHCTVPLLVRDDRPACLYPRTGVFATDGSNPDTTT